VTRSLRDDAVRKRVDEQNSRLELVMSDLVPTKHANILVGLMLTPSDESSSTPLDFGFSSLNPIFAICSMDKSSQLAARPNPRVIDANDPASVLADAEPGMCAISTDGSKLGNVVEVRIDPEAKTASIVVEYGLLGRRLKRIDGELVDLVDRNRVILSIDQLAFRELPDQQISRRECQ